MLLETGTILSVNSGFEIKIVNYEFSNIVEPLFSYPCNDIIACVCKITQSAHHTPILFILSLQVTKIW